MKEPNIEHSFCQCFPKDVGRLAGQVDNGSKYDSPPGNEKLTSIYSIEFGLLTVRSGIVVNADYFALKKLKCKN